MERYALKISTKPVPTRHAGFTLVEIIVTIVVSAAALGFLTTVFFASPSRSVEPILQIRATEFGQALLDEILGKKFDENTPTGGYPSCTVCTAEGALGSDGESRDQFDDVDDYNDYCNPGSPVPVENFRGTTPVDFSGFLMSICVTYDGDFDGTGADGDIHAKLITVEITPPVGAGLGSPIVFSAYRGNF